MHHFSEHHPELRGFSAFYEAQIYPRLLADDALRRRELTRWKEMSLLSGVSMGLLVSLLVFIKIKPPWPVYLLIAAFSVISALNMVKKPKLYVGFKTKKNILGGICRYLGWSYETDLAISPHIDLFKSLGLTPSKFDRESYEDRLKGDVRGAAFELYQAQLFQRQKSGQNTTWKSTFRGQFLVLDFPRNSFGRTVVLKDKGPRNPKALHGMQRVALVDPVFEKIYEAYGTDQVEARYLLTPTFMQRLVDLENSVDGKNMRFGFMGSHLLIAIETANRYDVGTMSEPLTNPARTQNILDEIGAIYDVIDGVMKR